MSNDDLENKRTEDSTENKENSADIWTGFKHINERIAKTIVSPVALLIEVIGFLVFALTYFQIQDGGHGWTSAAFGFFVLLIIYLIGLLIFYARDVRSVQGQKRKLEVKVAELEGALSQRPQADGGLFDPERHVERAELEAQRSRFKAELETERSRFNAERAKWRDITNNMVNENDVAYNFLKIEDDYVIRPNGDTIVRQKYWIEVLSDTLQFFRINMTGDRHSEPIYDLAGQTGFKVDVDKRDMEVEFVAVVDDPLAKKVLLFFLPRAVKGETLLVTIDYMWPKLMGDLDVLGETVFYWDYDGRNPTKSCDLRITMDFEVGWGPIRCEICHTEEPFEKLSYSDAKPNFLTFTYEHPNANVAERRYSLKFTKLNGPA